MKTSKLKICKPPHAYPSVLVVFISVQLLAHFAITLMKDKNRTRTSLNTISKATKNVNINEELLNSFYHGSSTKTLFGILHLCKITLILY